MNKIIVYTGNIGGYDKFREPKKIDQNIDYYYFTDNNDVNSNIYTVVNYKFKDSNLENRKKARFFKCCPHLILPKHDISIWVDSNFLPLFDDTESLLSTLDFWSKNIMCYPHRFRNCLYEEAEIVKNLKYDTAEIINNQITRYKNEGFPENYGLFESAFIIRKNNDIVNGFNELWWSEVEKYSGRDQVSQVYSAWKSNLFIDPITSGRDVFSNLFIGDYIMHDGKSIIPNWSMDKIMGLYSKK